MVDRRLQTASTDLVIDAGDAVGPGCGSFVWSTAKKAAELRVEERAAEADGCATLRMGKALGEGLAALWSEAHWVPLARAPRTNQTFD